MSLKKAIIAGHICLDILPDLSAVPEGQFKALIQPGGLIKTGSAKVITGGAVPNTGLALHSLGIPVTLIGKMGNDYFGQAIQDLINAVETGLSSGLIVDPNVPTAYTIIFNPPGFDRIFLHYPGANDFFYASDLPRPLLQEADLFHFGYPTMMRSVFRHNGAELVSILRRAQKCGLSTSLDFSFPDLNSPAGKADWENILYYSLPHTDLFLTSVEEITFMLEPETFHQINQRAETAFVDAVTPTLLQRLAKKALDLGVKAVFIKMAHRGLYLQTARAERWEKSGRALKDIDTTWFDRELWMPAFSVPVSGTTGAGDAAIAGFLGSILKSKNPSTALQFAAAAGAARVETASAKDNPISWQTLQHRIEAGWQTLPLALQNPHWTKDQNNGIWENKSNR